MTSDPFGDAATDFSNLFYGRTDAYGTWLGGKEDWPQDTTWPMWRHLADGPHVGVYCVRDGNVCAWGCVDIDGKDFAIEQPGRNVDGTHRPGETDWDQMWATAGNLVDALAYKECTAWTERTEHGIHVWVFADSLVPAASMRRALLAACQVIGYSPKEVNPKQEVVDEAKPFGNYVRLPYYGYFNHGMPKDRFVVDEDGPMTLEAFSRTAMGLRVDVGTLEGMAALYTPPAPKATSVIAAASNEDAFRLLEPILPALVRVIFADGPLNGDRSSSLIKVALILRDDGWQAQAVYTIVDALDLRLGKFVGRDDREERLLEIVEKYGT